MTLDAIRARDDDLHVVPVGQQHDDSPQCWCRPVIDFEDVVTLRRVWLHRRAHDLPIRAGDADVRKGT